MTQPKATKGKILLGYALLFLIALVSVWFVYTEIVKIIAPDKGASEDNQRVLQISNTITSLYDLETVGRNAILTGSAKDFAEYNRMMDSINAQIEQIKQQSDAAQLGKLDTIRQLLARKRNSLTEIIAFRKAYNERNTFDRAVGQITRVKDSLNRRVKPIQFENKTQLRQFLTSVLTKRQMDSLSRLPVSNEQLTDAIEKMLTKVIIRDNKMKYQLFRKEQKLQDENRIISDQLRVVLSALEKEMLQKSYAKINRSKTALRNTVQTLAWIGAGSFLLLIIFAWIILRDLSRSQRYRQQLEQLNLEKENLLRSKAMLLATVTHDIQTPLGGIIGFSQLMQKTDPTAKQAQYLDNIGHSAQYILKLVNDLLDFSKLENNRIAIEQVRFNFKDLIDSICRPLEQNALQKHIELRWDCDEALDAPYTSDPYRLKQILTNLVSNAIKFTQEGSVEVVAKKAGGWIEVSVIDTGIGIAKSEQEYVFREFTQAHAGIEKKFGGTGLGLTIAQRMLELLGGSITLESQEGQGSIFTVRVPAVSAQMPETTVAAPQLPDTRFLSGKKILMVDDDAMQLALMRELFSGIPVSVTTISDAAQVLPTLESQTFDVLLSDVQMPKMDGFELVRMIRNQNDPQIAQLPVIALSGKRDLDHQDFTSRGFTGFHPKPVQFEALLLQLRALFEMGAVQALGRQQQTRDYDKFFDLSGLLQFTQDDAAALRHIIENFIESSRENFDQLQQYALEGNLQQTSNLAHKMLPMMRQLRVWRVVDLLEPLEDQTVSNDASGWKSYMAQLGHLLEDLYVKLRIALP